MRRAEALLRPVDVAMTTQERLRKADYCVRPVPLITAHRCEVLYHYAHGGSKAGKAYGLFLTAVEASCLGVAHYNMCQREQGDLAWAGGWREVWTLHRLAIAPQAPANAASFLIRRSARLLATETGARCLLAYSDTWQGHTGHVYRAAGWEYTGLVRGDKTWVDPRTGRLVAQRRGNRTLTDAEMAARGYEDHGYHDKHRYRLTLAPTRPPRTLFDALGAPPGAADPQRLRRAGRGRAQPGTQDTGQGARRNDAGDGGAEGGATRALSPADLGPRARSGAAALAFPVEQHADERAHAPRLVLGPLNQLGREHDAGLDGPWPRHAARATALLVAVLNHHTEIIPHSSLSHGIILREVLGNG